VQPPHTPSLHQVHLIRHGQSAGNIESDTTAVYHGAHDESHLTELGKTQIEALAQFLPPQLTHPVKLWCSPVTRALESAEILETQLKLRPVKIDRALRDQSYGDVEGHTEEWFKEKFPSTYQEWKNDPLQTNFPQGESLVEVQHRVGSWLFEALPRYPAATHVVLTHEEVIRAALALTKPEDRLYYHLRKHVPKLPNASVTTLEVSGNQLKIVRIAQLPS
jgi:2,3-bisphosphoglycerate-dependent phosphoglycerate mutase